MLLKCEYFIILIKGFLCRLGEAVNTALLYLLKLLRSTEIEQTVIYLHIQQTQSSVSIYFGVVFLAI